MPNETSLVSSSVNQHDSGYFYGQTYAAPINWAASNGSSQPPADWNSSWTYRPTTGSIVLNIALLNNETMVWKEVFAAVSREIFMVLAFNRSLWQYFSGQNQTTPLGIDNIINSTIEPTDSPILGRQWFIGQPTLNFS